MSEKGSGYATELAWPVQSFQKLKTFLMWTLAVSGSQEGDGQRIPGFCGFFFIFYFWSSGDTLPPSEDSVIDDVIIFLKY